MLSLENVGPQEVNMSNINEHISSFRKGVKSIQVPIVNYKKSSFTRHELKLTNVDVLIVEGVYSFLLENLDYKIFLKRTYVDSLNVRANRTREKYDPFVELVLAIEHDIVEPMIHEADFIVDKNNTIL